MVGKSLKIVSHFCNGIKYTAHVFFGGKRLMFLSVPTRIFENSALISRALLKSEADGNIWPFQIMFVPR